MGYVGSKALSFWEMLNCEWHTLRPRFSLSPKKISIKDEYEFSIYPPFEVKTLNEWLKTHKMLLLIQFNFWGKKYFFLMTYLFSVERSKCKCSDVKDVLVSCCKKSQAWIQSYQLTAWPSHELWIVKEKNKIKMKMSFLTFRVSSLVIWKKLGVELLLVCTERNQVCGAGVWLKWWGISGMSNWHSQGKSNICGRAFLTWDKKLLIKK